MRRGSYFTTKDTKEGTERQARRQARLRNANHNGRKSRECDVLHDVAGDCKFLTVKDCG